MKKIFITFTICLMATFGYCQITTKRIVQGDTLLVVTETKTTKDTMSRTQLKDEVNRFKNAKKAGVESIAIQTKLNAFYDAEIVRLTALLRKTD